MIENQCPYCKSAETTVRYRNHFHKFQDGYGPFDFYVCRDCGCGFCNPLPTRERLNAFYAVYSSGMPDEYRAAMREYEDSSWHSQIANDLAKLARQHGFAPDFAWLDVGAGAGEIAGKLSKLLSSSRGHCIDLHSPPETVNKSNIAWIQADINTDFSHGVTGKYKLVYASAVLEHVMYPSDFLSSCLSLLDRGGILYMFCPDYSSLASKVMGTSWPYYIPGEHLTLPTVNSIEKCVDYLAGSGSFDIAGVVVRRKLINYSVKYMLFALRLKWMNNLLPFDFSMKFPTGALELIVTKDE